MGWTLLKYVHVGLCQTLLRHVGSNGNKKLSLSAYWLMVKQSLQTFSEDSFKVSKMIPSSCLVNQFFHMQRVIKVLFSVRDKIFRFDRFTWKHVIANCTFSLQDMEIIVFEGNVYSPFETESMATMCMCVYVLCVGHRREEGNHLDDYGPNLLVSSDPVNRADSVQTQINGFLSYDCI